jgi:putative membrane protein
MQIPVWLTKQVDERGLEKIRQAVVRAEQKTSGELVPVIVRSSAPTGHVLWILFLALSALGATVLPLLPARSTLVQALTEIGIFVFAFVLALVLSKFNFFKRLCTSSRDLSGAVLARAQLEFYQLGLKNTAGASGILLFVSLFEREAVVLADEGIAKLCPPETWRETIAKMIEGVRREDFATGMADALEHCAQILSEKFPRHANDRDELPNRLIIKD